MATTVQESATLQSKLEQVVEHLSAIERPSASAGERQAAEWIATRLQDIGCKVAVEEEKAHGTFWWPLGLLSAIGVAAGGIGLGRSNSKHRLPATLAGSLACAGIWNDLSSGDKQWFRHHFLPKRSTWNVVAEVGDLQAKRTLVVLAHHDAANTGLLFHPKVFQWWSGGHPAITERIDTSLPIMAPVLLGPLMVTLGNLTRRKWLTAAGTAMTLSSIASFADIGSQQVVPGANDNLSGVAALFGVAQKLQQKPVKGLRVLLVSTGSEESFLEGMRAFGRRHFADLPQENTRFICLDTVGSPELVLVEGEGMLRMRGYDRDFKKLIGDCAASAKVNLRRGMRIHAATDGLISHLAGYKTALIASMNQYKRPSNYHTMQDTPENIEWNTVNDAIKVCDAAIRRLASKWPA